MAKKVERIPTVIKGVPQIGSRVTPGTPLYADYVIAGDFVFISGQTAIDPETGVCIANTMQEQMQIVLAKIDGIMQKCGSSLENIVKELVILKDMADYPVMRNEQQKYYRVHAPSLLENPPGSTVLAPAQLVRPYYFVEIEAVGYIPPKE